MRGYTPTDPEAQPFEPIAGPKVLMRRVANIYDDFNPVLWAVDDVAILYDTTGEAKGFYYMNMGNVSEGDVCWRDNIPAEIFNHQIKDIDGASPKLLAEFMTEYGMIFDSWPGSINEMAEYCRNIKICKSKKSSGDEIDNLIEHLRQKAINSPTSSGRDKTRELWQAEYERMKQFANDRWCDFKPRLFLVSVEEVQENIDIIYDFVELAKAASQSEEETEIARLTGIHRDDMLDEVLYLDHMLNGLLHVFHPKVGFQFIVDGEVGFPTYNGDLRDIHASDGPMSASLMNAIALQIRNFNIHLSNARQCMECGDIFVTKQTKRATKYAHSDSLFCCDKCKNRYTQRKHRKTPGYRQKQDAKRKAIQ